MALVLLDQLDSLAENPLLELEVIHAFEGVIVNVCVTVPLEESDIGTHVFETLAGRLVVPLLEALVEGFLHVSEHPLLRHLDAFECSLAGDIPQPRHPCFDLGMSLQQPLSIALW